MINVYISKSNEASMDDLLLVRTAIKKYPEFNILEHTGGAYDTELVKKASIIIVIPNLKATVPMVVGKGIYGEALTIEADYSFVYVGNDLIRKITGGEIDDSTNWKKYGLLKTNDNASTLEQTLQAILKIKNVAIQSSDKTNYNHLIEE